MWRMATVFVVVAALQPREAVEPRVSLIYCGTPQGLPRTSDLEAARVLGVSAISWSCGDEGPAELFQLAAPLGLKVVVGTAAAVEAVTIPVTRAEAVWPLAWRAIAHGTRIVALDPGRMTSLARIASPPPSWSPVVAALERQFRANGVLFAQSRPGPPVTLDGSPAAIDVSLLDAGRSWIVVATNASSATMRVTAHLPPAVPYAMWVNLLDGSTMAMLDEPKGPRWVFDLDAWAAKVYVIDKTLK